jgi:hypothetical protein
MIAVRGRKAPGCGAIRPQTAILGSGQLLMLAITCLIRV